MQSSLCLETETKEVRKLNPTAFNSPALTRGHANFQELFLVISNLHIIYIYNYGIKHGTTQMKINFYYIKQSALISVGHATSFNYVRASGLD